MAGVPFIFGNATTSIPLSNLDADFNTPVTIGNTTVGLGNTVTTLGNVTLNNVTITSGTINASVTEAYTLANAVVYSNSTNVGTTSANLTFNGTTLTTANDASISGLTVGKGNGSLSQNTVVGSGLGSTTGNANCAFGVASLRDNTTGNGGCSFGYASLVQNTTGIGNSAYGYSSLFGNTTGGSNSAFGYQALNSNTTASNNTAVGYQAGFSNTVNTNQTLIGYRAGYTSNPTNTVAGNTCVGSQSGYSLTTGYQNTFIGGSNNSTGSAGYFVTTGAKNTILGCYDGNQGGLDIRTSSNYIVLADGDGNPSAYWDSSGVFYNTNGGAYFAGTSPRVSPLTDNVGYIGDNTHRWQAVYAVNGTIQTSDATQKTNVENTDLGLDFVSALRPVKFNWIDSEYGRTHYGFIAQEIEQTLKEKNAGDFGGLVIDKAADGSDFYGLRHHELIAPLVKAIQELKAEVDSLKQQLGK